jgi:hypothetical protein
MSETTSQFQRRRITALHKLRIVTAGLISAWLFFSLLQHVFIELSHLVSRRTIASLSHRIALPATVIRYQTSSRQGVDSTVIDTGVVAPGIVTPDESAEEEEEEEAGTFGVAQECVPTEEVESPLRDEGDQTCSCSVIVNGKKYPAPNFVCNILAPFFICFLIAMLIDLLLGLICESDWVKESVACRRCFRKDCKWYNVICHLSKLICFLGEVLKWILQQICKARAWIVWGIWTLCFTILAFLALWALFG